MYYIPIHWEWAWWGMCHDYLEITRYEVRTLDRRNYASVSPVRNWKTRLLWRIDRDRLCVSFWQSIFGENTWQTYKQAYAEVQINFIRREVVCQRLKKYIQEWTRLTYERLLFCGIGTCLSKQEKQQINEWIYYVGNRLPRNCTKTSTNHNWTIFSGLEIDNNGWESDLGIRANEPLIQIEIHEFRLLQSQTMDRCVILIEKRFLVCEMRLFLFDFVAQQIGIIPSVYCFFLF